MNLFEPDFFSVSSPIWNDCTSERFDFINELIFHNYGYLIADIKRVKQVGGIEINSNNYCIETSCGKFLLKKWGDTLSISDIQTICKLSDSLVAKQVPLSKLIPADGDVPIINFSDKLWSLFDFNEGDFFSGTIEELHTVAASIGTLFNVLSSVTLENIWLKAPEICSESDRLLYRAIFNSKNEVLSSFLKKDREALELNWGNLLKEVTYIYSAKLNAGPLQLSHFDLHPHNILMANNRLSTFLDIDSIRLMNSGYALGFASMKLCRQAVVTTQKMPQEVAEVWMKILGESLNEKENMLSFIGDLAVAEVLRRIAAILRFNLVDSNTEWNSFLRVQLNHLKEARVLFNTFSN